MHPRVKLADFGLSLPLSQDSIKTYGGHLRWRAPELWHDPKSDYQLTNEDLLKSDMYSYGLILLFLITGKNPWHDEPIEYPSQNQSRSSSSSSHSSWIEPPPGDRYQLPESLAPELWAVVELCYVEQPNERVNSSQLNTERYKGEFSVWICMPVHPLVGLSFGLSIFRQSVVCLAWSLNLTYISGCIFAQSDRENPFRVEDISGEFFSCGFLEDTKIFVADSRVTEVCCHSHDCQWLPLASL